jgi:hypothetical protein
MNIGLSKAVRPHDIENQSDKPVHILASRDPCPLTLVGFSGFDLF